MKVVNLWRISKVKEWPQALHEALKIPRLLLTFKTVSGLSQASQSTNFRMNISNMSCNLAASWEPLTMYRSFLWSNWVWAPSSQPKNLVGSEKQFLIESQQTLKR